VLVSAGIPEEQAHFYAEGVRRGGTLVTVRTGDVADSSVRDILQRNGAVDMGARGAEWRRAGWSRFEPDAGPPTREWQKASADATAEDGGDLPSGGPAATSIGALSGGTIPGGYGPAGDVIFGHDDAGDRRRPD
jgi:hypothetical protein